MSLQTRLEALITAIGADIKSLNTQIAGKLGVGAKAADSDLLDGFNADMNNTVNSVVVRNGSGDINTRLFRSEYTTLTTTPNYIMAQHAAGTTGDNYIRPTSLAQLKTSLGKMNDSELLDGIDSAEFLRKGMADGTGSRNTKVVASLNDYLVSGWYDGSNMVGAPSADWWFVEVISHTNGAHWQRQIAYSFTKSSESATQAVYSRRCNGGNPTLAGSWSAWVRIDDPGTTITDTIDGGATPSETYSGLTAASLGPSSDPWTYVVLAADEISTVTTQADTALRFTPEPSKLYEVEAVLYMRSVATTTGVRPGINWPASGISQEVGWIQSGVSATGFVSRIIGNSADVAALGTGVAVANEGIFGALKASFVTDLTGPPTDFIVTVSTEIAGSEVRLAANSWLKYRVIDR